MAKKTDGWRLISVLFSSRPLSAGLALTLYETAAELHRTDGSSREIGGDTLSGRVKNLRRVEVLGAISGPAFEARIESDEHGTITVRYLLTVEGQRKSRRKKKAPALLH